MSGHPTPWRAYKHAAHSAADGRWGVRDAHGVRLAANLEPPIAHKFAASPDLLEAAKPILRQYDQDDVWTGDMWDALRSAIEKAEDLT